MNLEQQLKEYDQSLKQLKVDCEGANFYSAKRAIMAKDKNPAEWNRQQFNSVAKQRGFEEIESTLAYKKLENI